MLYCIVLVIVRGRTFSPSLYTEADMPLWSRCVMKEFSIQTTEYSVSKLRNVVYPSLRIIADFGNDN